MFEDMINETVEETARQVDVILLTGPVEPEAVKPEEPKAAEPEVTTVCNMPPVKAKKKRWGFGKKVVAAALIAAIGGSAVGFGAAIGGGVYGQYIASGQSVVQAEAAAPQPEETQKVFTFANTSDTDTDRSVITGTANKKTSGVVSIVRAVSDAVVSINVTAPVQTFMNQTFDQTGSGSGIIFAESGDKVYIATNNHVINSAKQVTISVDDENEVTAHFVGSDSQSDLAVIYVLKEEMAKAGIQYKVAAFGDSDELEVGEAVVAIGNALGEGKTATLGIISATNKKITIDGKNLNVIQTDAAINPGNSGGALVDENGEVIGINTAKLSSSTVEGTGYSIPSNTVKTVIEDLIKNGSVKKAYLGVQGRTITEEMKTQYNLPSTGAYIQQVFADSGAQESGLTATDIIIGYNDEKITSMEDLSAAIAKSKVGDQVKLSIYRNGKTPMELIATIKNMNTEPTF